MSWRDRLSQCRRRAEAYFRSQRLEEGDALFWRNSPAHDVKCDPGHLLYGTWAGILGSALLEPSTLGDGPVRDTMASGLNRFQSADGFFRIAGIPPAAMDGHDDEYFSFHCTNYALGALDFVGRPPRFPLAFLDPFFDPSFTARWLDDRDWGRPWTEGNTVVNLASFFELGARVDRPNARARLAQIADWLEEHQSPDTGFWHSEGVPYLPAMAGAAHLLHVFYALGRRVPRAERIVDSCVERGYPGIRAACADIDLVDILCHLRPYGHRVPAIDEILRRYLTELLQIQNADGGFCDSYVTPLTTYGLVTPRDVSATWTTWFRLATIGMISVSLVPGEAGRWHFRKTPGTGYFPPAPPMPSGRQEASVPPAFSPLAEIRLAAVRRARFFRQHLTWQARRWMSGTAG
jgi:hypothetical protein